ncbi:Tetratricopeptide repeat (TPR)-like superfamily protein [Abeliophyllum distichum]|uniref:Tetratricopeptide repeat (TPR)-like superfamily protein n=1 Tax=Abeliophyllum distichum TaxID=126358 RepID=A0ABD1RH38_9LAMI
MAALFAGRKAIISSSAPLIQKSTATKFSSILRHGLSRKPRWASSSSSSSSSSSAKPNKSNKVTSDRLSAVIDAVNDSELPPELRGQRNSVRTETDIVNVVERRVWHAMEEGQFENLPGKGKPLDLSSNPHVDPAEDTLYRILNKNGCAPEWVELNKEIRNNIVEWRVGLKKAWKHKGSRDDAKWVECSEALKFQLKSINDKVCSVTTSLFPLAVR